MRRNDGGLSSQLGLTKDEIQQWIAQIHVGDGDDFGRRHRPFSHELLKQGG